MGPQTAALNLSARTVLPVPKHGNPQQEDSLQSQISLVSGDRRVPNATPNFVSFLNPETLSR